MVNVQNLTTRQMLDTIGGEYISGNLTLSDEQKKKTLACLHSNEDRALISLCFKYEKNPKGCLRDIQTNSPELEEPFRAMMQNRLTVNGEASILISRFLTIESGMEIHTAPQPEHGKSNIFTLLQNDIAESEIHPAQDCVNGVIYYAVKIQGKPYLVTSNREIISFEDCPGMGLKLSRGEIDKYGFSNEGLGLFLRGESDVAPYGIFEKIAPYIRRFVVFKDPDCFTFLSLWIIGTYIFRVFRYYPYIHLRGEKGSAKTLLMDVMAPISFNGEVLLNTTEAVLFRDVQNNEPTLFLDEVEKFRPQDRETHGAVMDVLKSGFSKSGLVKRCGGKDKDKIHSFHTYSPKVLAGINEIDDVLRDRTVEIPMVRRLKSEEVERYRENKSTEELQRKIRDELYSFGLTYGPMIAEHYQNNSENVSGLDNLNNREYDIWAPIIFLANIIDDCKANSKITGTIVRFSQRRIAERSADDNADNTTNRLLVTLNTMLRDLGPVKRDGNVFVYDTESTFRFFKAQDEFSWLESKSWLTRHLRSIDVHAGVQKISGRATRVYLIDKTKLKDFTERYVVCENPTVTVTEPVTAEFINT